MAETRLVDYSFARPKPATIKSYGYKGAVRYLGGSASKQLTKAEAVSLHAAGLAILLVFEGAANRASTGHANGAVDAKTARAKASALGYPGTLPLFFAVDYDASASAVADYFAGVKSVLGDRAGIYGGIGVMGIDVAWKWQTAAWSGGKLSPQAHLYQRAKAVGKLPSGCDQNVVCKPLPMWGPKGVVTLTPPGKSGEVLKPTPAPEPTPSQPSAGPLPGKEPTVQHEAVILPTALADKAVIGVVQASGRYSKSSASLGQALLEFVEAKGSGVDPIPVSVILGTEIDPAARDKEVDSFFAKRKNPNWGVHSRTTGTSFANDSYIAWRGGIWHALAATHVIVTRDKFLGGAAGKTTVPDQDATIVVLVHRPTGSVIVFGELHAPAGVESGDHLKTDAASAPKVKAWKGANKGYLKALDAYAKKYDADAVIACCDDNVNVHSGPLAKLLTTLWTGYKLAASPAGGDLGGGRAVSVTLYKGAVEQKSAWWWKGKAGLAASDHKPKGMLWRITTPAAKALSKAAAK